jgi:hypothetical protein
MSDLTYSELYFTSDRYDSGSNNRPNYLLSHDIQHIRKLKVGSAVIPYSFYVINSNNNGFTFEETAGGGSVSFNLVEGNYSATTFTAQLKSQLEANSVNGYTYTVSISSSTNKITISTASNFIIELANSNGITGYSSTTGASTIHTGNNVVNLAGTNNVYLRSNLATHLARNTIVENSNLYNNILAQIPLNGTTGSIIYKDFIDSEFLDIQTALRDIEFYITDEDDKIIDFNGAPFSVKLQLYKERN